MTKEQKQYILDHRTDLENNDLDAFFDYDDPPEGICNIIYGAIPDFLEHISYVQEWGFYKSEIKSIEIPDSVTELRDHAFYDCNSLQSITISNSVTKIGDHAFMYCTSLQSITIPDSVTVIGDRAFYGCDSLQFITIPDSVEDIGTLTFSSCTSLQSITIPESVTHIGYNTFFNCPATIKCKKGSYAAKYAIENNINLEYI